MNTKSTKKEFMTTFMVFFTTFEKIFGSFYIYMIKIYRKRGQMYHIFIVIDSNYWQTNKIRPYLKIN